MTPSPENSPQPPKRAKRVERTDSVSITPSDRLAVMTQDRVASLARDKESFRSEAARLQMIVARLSPENARLHEALRRAESGSMLATILVGIGGFLVSYASFTGGSAKWWANVSLGLLVAGIGLMTWQSWFGYRGESSR